MVAKVNNLKCAFTVFGGKELTGEYVAEDDLVEQSGETTYPPAFEVRSNLCTQNTL